MKKYRLSQLLKEENGIFISRGENCDELHSHDFIEIFYVWNGQAEEYVDASVYTVKAGDLVFINYGCSHRFEGTPDFSYVNLCFLPETMTKSILTPENAFGLLQLSSFEDVRRGNDSGVISFRGKERSEVEGYLAAMENEYREKRLSWKVAMESYMNLLLVAILRKRAGGEEPDEDVWKMLSDYIDKNPDGDLTLPALARRCFYNPSYFSRVFKEKFSMPLTEYINGKRVERAKALAQIPTLSVGEIAEQSGFSSRTSFYRVFRQMTGMSFTDFRKNQKTDEKK